MNKIKLFTHNDLDGISCGIIGKLTYDDIDIEYCNYNDINEKIKSYLDEPGEMDFVYITDISVNEEVAEIINETNKKAESNYFQLLDHHKTAEWLNKYDWATVIDIDNNKKQSGTNLFYEYLISNEGLKQTIQIEEFVELARQYDTWEWKKYDIQKAKDLNDILHMIGDFDFIFEYYHNLKDCKDHFQLSEMHLKLLHYKRLEIDRYIESKLDKVKIFNDENKNKVAFVVADNNISELGSKICEATDCDYCCIYTGFNMSMRSIGEFDVSIIAKKYGGGGHKNASGMPTQKFYIDRYIDKI